MKKNKFVKVAFLILVLCVAVACISMIMQLNAKQEISYENLTKEDRLVLSEIESIQRNQDVWTDFDFKSKTVLAINKEKGYGLLFNPQKPLNSLWAKRITDESGEVIDAYMISALSPQMLRFKLPGNFNQIDKTYQFMGSKIYYIKYDASNFGKNNDSNHFVNFLTHEAFHYYMQQNWSPISRTDVYNLKENELKLMEEQYEVLEDIRVSMKDEKEIRALLKTYFEILDERLALKSGYTTQEMTEETVEGTATYVGMHYSKNAGYNIEVMNFTDDDYKDEELPFDIIIPAIADGTMSAETLTTDWYYHTGAFLCEVADYLKIPDWQEKLNGQVEGKEITIHEVIKEWIK